MRKKKQDYSPLADWGARPTNNKPPYTLYILKTTLFMLKNIISLSIAISESYIQLYVAPLAVHSQPGRRRATARPLARPLPTHRGGSSPEQLQLFLSSWGKVVVTTPETNDIVCLCMFRVSQLGSNIGSKGRIEQQNMPKHLKPTRSTFHFQTEWWHNITDGGLYDPQGPLKSLQMTTGKRPDTSTSIHQSYTGVPNIFHRPM